MVVEDVTDRLLAERIDLRTVTADVLPRPQAPGSHQVFSVHAILLSGALVETQDACAARPSPAAASRRNVEVAASDKYPAPTRRVRARLHPATVPRTQRPGSMISDTPSTERAAVPEASWLRTRPAPLVPVAPSFADDG